MASEAQSKIIDDGELYLSKMHRTLKNWADNGEKEKPGTGIPQCPSLVYWNNGWNGWADFLGVEPDRPTFKECCDSDSVDKCCYALVQRGDVADISLNGATDSQIQEFVSSVTPLLQKIRQHPILHQTRE